MQGRIENEIKMEKMITDKISDYPDFVKNWNRNLKANNQTAQTRRTFINTLIRFLSFINPCSPTSVSVSDITREITEEFIYNAQTKTIIRNGVEETVYTSDSYKQVTWSALNNFFKFMVSHDEIKKNYMDDIKKAKNRDLERINKDRVLLTEDDFNKIINAAMNGVGSDKAKMRQFKFRNRDLAILLMFMTTGMRKTALTEINIGDINFSDGTFETIDKNKTQNYKLNQKVLGVINDWLEDRKSFGFTSDALFVTYEGKRMSGTSIDDIVNKYCQDALGKHVSPHKLRAGFCSILFNKTGNIEYVRRAVGHSNVTTTQRYVVTDNSEREQASMMILNGLSF